MSESCHSLLSADVHVIGRNLGRFVTTIVPKLTAGQAYYDAKVPT